MRYARPERRRREGRRKRKVDIWPSSPSVWSNLFKLFLLLNLSIWPSLTSVLRCYTYISDVLVYYIRCYVRRWRIILWSQACPPLHWCRRGSSLHRGTPTCWPGTPPPSQTSSSTKCSTEDCRWAPSSLPPSSLFTLALVTNGYLFAFFPGPIYILFSEMFKVCSDFLFLVFPIFPVFCDINHPLDIWLFL